MRKQLILNLMSFDPACDTPGRTKVEMLAAIMATYLRALVNWRWKMKETQRESIRQCGVIQQARIRQSRNRPTWDCLYGICRRIRQVTPAQREDKALPLVQVWVSCQL